MCCVHVSIFLGGSLLVCVCSYRVNFECISWNGLFMDGQGSIFRIFFVIFEVVSLTDFPSMIEYIILSLSRISV